MLNHQIFFALFSQVSVFGTAFTKLVPFYRHLHRVRGQCVGLSETCHTLAPVGRELQSVV